MCSVDINITNKINTLPRIISLHAYKYVLSSPAKKNNLRSKLFFYAAEGKGLTKYLYSCTLWLRRGDVYITDIT